MAKTVIGLYDDRLDAQRAIRSLVDAGFDHDNISMLMQDTRETPTEGRREEGSHAAEGAGAGAGIGAVLGGIGGLLVGLGALAIPGIGPLVAAGPLITTLAGAGVGAGVGALVGALIGMGVPEEEAQYYVEGVRRGGTLVAVKTSDELANRAVDIMEDHNPVDIQRRAAQWRTEGWTPVEYETSEQVERPRMTETTPRQSVRESQKPELKEMREELKVGKREREEGGVRIRSHMYEEPVEEDITLREEHVDVERRRVDRPASDKDFEAFKEGEMEIREHTEEPVVSKEARVTEEIDVDKDVTQRQETIRDTVRRTEVDVDRIGDEKIETRSTGTRMTGQTHETFEFAEEEPYFREHFQSHFGSRGGTYDRYRQAYGFGYTMAQHPDYQNRNWSEIEPQVQEQWQSRNAGPWEDFKDAIQEGWNRITTRRTTGTTRRTR